MLHRSRARLVLGIFMLLAMAIGMSGATRAVESELERELRRELHRMPPPALLPTPATLACYERLAKISRYVPLPIQAEPAQCATADLVRIDRVLMPDMTQVSVTPPAVLLCSMAEAVAQWIRHDVGPAAAELGSPLAAVTDLDSYECRPRNRVAGAKLSEHGKGNALDVSAIKLRNGGTFNLSDPVVSKPFREQMRVAACGRFTTVLGPGSDGYHSDHIHLDLAERSRGYRICQWNVRDPGPIVADVPLPLPRPMNLATAPSKSRRSEK